MANHDDAYEILKAKFEILKSEFPEVTFGYIGNCGVDRSGKFDDRSWYVFLPHTGRVGTYADRVGGYTTDNLRVMVEDWDKIVTRVRKAMVVR